FRARDPDRHRDREAPVLPARQQVLRLDGQDEGGAARDGGDPRALRRRQDEAADRADGALQEGEDQPARRLPALRPCKQSSRLENGPNVSFPSPSIMYQPSLTPRRSDWASLIRWGIGSD